MEGAPRRADPKGGMLNLAEALLPDRQRLGRWNCFQPAAVLHMWAALQGPKATRASWCASGRSSGSAGALMSHPAAPGGAPARSACPARGSCCPLMSCAFCLGRLWWASSQLASP